MRLINESAVEQADLLPILSFVSAYIGSHKRVVVFADNAKDSARMTSGYAGYGDGRVIVKLNLRNREAFTGPYPTREVPTVPYMNVTSWEEELVLVAAHELRHAEQLLAGTYAKDEVIEAETDAELFAGMVLDAYRRK